MCLSPWAPVDCPLSMGFSRQEPWKGLPFPPPGGRVDAGVKPPSPAALASAGGLWTTGPGKSSKSYTESPNSQSRVIPGRPLLPSDAWHQCQPRLVFEFVHFPPEKERVGLFSFIFVNYLVLLKISCLPIDSLLAECHVLPSNKHAQFRYLFPSIFQTFLYQSASIIMGLREIQWWEEKLQIENLRFFCFLST